MIWTKKSLPHTNIFKEITISFPPPPTKLVTKAVKFTTSVILFPAPVIKYFATVLRYDTPTPISCCLLADIISCLCSLECENKQLIVVHWRCQTAGTFPREERKTRTQRAIKQLDNDKRCYQVLQQSTLFRSGFLPGVRLLRVYRRNSQPQLRHETELDVTRSSKRFYRMKSILQLFSCCYGGTIYKSRKSKTPRK